MLGAALNADPGFVENVVRLGPAKALFGYNKQNEKYSFSTAAMFLSSGMLRVLEISTYQTER